MASQTDQALQLLDRARQAAAESGDSAARFTLELAEGALSYIRGRFETALALVDSSLRTSAGPGEEHRAVVCPPSALRGPGRHGPLRRSARGGHREHRGGAAGPAGLGAAHVRDLAGPRASAAGEAGRRCRGAGRALRPRRRAPRRRHYGRGAASSPSDVWQSTPGTSARPPSPPRSPPSCCNPVCQ